MKVLCVDDEPIVLEEVRELVASQPDVNEAAAFLSSEKALEWAKANSPDAAFLDINMARMNGLMLAKCIKEHVKDCAIVFVTGYSQYAVDAFALRADGYLLKPATAADVRCELDNIKSKRPLCAPASANRIRVQCFGNFEAFANGAPLRFERGKTKELLAYLVDRHGGSATMGELIAVLWEDAPDTSSIRSNLRNLIYDLKSTLSRVGADNVLVKDRDTVALNCAHIDCDFYDFQKRMPYAVNLYRGEYMCQYSWAEITGAELF